MIRLDNFHEQLLDAMPQMVWVGDATCFNIVYFNKKWYDYTGLNGNDATHEWVSVVHPDEIAVFTQTINESIKTKQPFSFEHRIKRKFDGQYRWHLTRGVPVFDKNGRITNWVGTNTDIHDSKVEISKWIQEYESRIARYSLKLDTLT